jgi:ABC-type uncharacterized transport system substrate-binding protein
VPLKSIPVHGRAFVFLTAIGGGLAVGVINIDTGAESMTKTILISFLVTFFLSTAPLAEAQQPKKIPRIGYVSGTGDAANQGPYVEALRRGLRDLGDIEGKDFTIEYRGAEGKPGRIPSLVTELVQLKVDVLIAPILPVIRAAKQATKTIPIVMVINTDPVESGIVNSLARPGGNITGFATLSSELSGKRLELLKEMVPRLSRVGVLRGPDEESTVVAFKEYSDAARALKIQIQSLEVRGPNPNLDGAFQTAKKDRVNGLITITTAPLFLQQKRVAELAIKNRLPSGFQGATWVEAGGLMSYSTDEIAVFRQAARHVDKILKGTRPADIPVEQPMKFEFVINLKTANQIGLTIPQWTLMKADNVIQ